MIEMTTATMWKRAARLYLPVILTAIFGICPSIDAGTLNQQEFHLIVEFEVPSHVSGLLFDPNDRSRLYIAMEQKRELWVVSAESRSVDRYVELDFEPAALAMREHDQNLFLVGSSGEQFQRGFFSRLDTASWKLETTRLSTPVLRPDIAMSSGGVIYISDMDSSSILGFRATQFGFDRKNLETSTRLPKGGPIFLKDGPGVNIAMTDSERGIVVAHYGKSIISVVDAWSGEVVDRLGWAGKHEEERTTELSFGIQIAKDQESEDEGSKPRNRTFLFLVDAEEDVVVKVEIDADDLLTDVNSVLKTGLELREIAKTGKRRPPASIATALFGNITLVSSPYRDQITIFVTSSGRMFQRAGSIKMRKGITRTALSPFGRYLAVYNEELATVTLMARNVDQ